MDPPAAYWTYSRATRSTSRPNIRRIVFFRTHLVTVGFINYLQVRTRCTRAPKGENLPLLRWWLRKASFVLCMSRTDVSLLTMLPICGCFGGQTRLLLPCFFLLLASLLMYCDWIPTEKETWIFLTSHHMRISISVPDCKLTSCLSKKSTTYFQLTIHRTPGRILTGARRLEQSQWEASAALLRLRVVFWSRRHGHSCTVAWTSGSGAVWRISFEAWRHDTPLKASYKSSASVGRSPICVTHWEEGEQGVSPSSWCWRAVAWSIESVALPSL